jgi:hypothetical protein
VSEVLVLYEDSRAARGVFGPHEFFLGCVADDRVTSVHALARRASSCPLRGISKLLAALKQLDGFDNLVEGGGPILAVVDEDRVREHIPESTAWSAVQVAQHLVATSSDPSRLMVVLLERNLESLIEAIRQCGERELELIEAALRKELNGRDTLLGKVGHDPGRRLIRDCVRRTMPSVESVVVRLRSALS